MRTVGVAGPFGNDTDFDRLRNCLAEALQGSQEIEEALLGYFEHWKNCAKEFSAHQASRIQEEPISPVLSAPPTPGNQPPGVEHQQTLLAEQIEHLRCQSAELGETISQLHQLRTDLTSWVAETFLLAKSSPNRSQKENPAENRLLEELQRLQKERDALEAKRRQLETLLAEKTHEAARLAELVEQQKRQMARQQEQWAKHLQILKPLVDALFGHLAESPFQEEAPSPSVSGSSEGVSENEGVVQLAPFRGRRSSTG